MIEDIWLSLFTVDLFGGLYISLAVLEFPVLTRLAFKVEPTNNLIVKFSAFSFCPIYL